MPDAQKALNKCRPHNKCTNFLFTCDCICVHGWKYTEVTELWGEMKVLAVSRSLRFDQDFLDSLLHCFVCGVFFLWAMEVIEMMETGDMFIDKYKYWVTLVEILCNFV
jgi:hypothetical protein